MKISKKIVALILCLALVVSMTACQTQTTTQQQETSTPAQTDEGNKEEVFEDTISWDAEYDVIVVGYGMAGAATSIQAAEKGAKVLLLEKAPKGHEGGNSKYAGQGFVTVDSENRDKALEYFKRIRGKYNTPEDDVLAAFTDTIITNADWINSLGGNAIIVGKSIGEFRDIEGWDLMNAWSINGKIFDAGAYNFLHSVVEKNDLIDVWYEAPGEQLIQDPETKIVHGVVAGVDGEKYNIRAKNGVVLCTGGFENNQQMIQDYLQLPYGYSKGALYNTGDGIKMAMEVGADLWHMGNIAGPDLNAIDKETGRSYGYAIQGEHPLLSTKFTLGNVIFVGADGTRFVDESVSTGHGFIDFHGMKLRMPVSLPAYCVFDSTAINNTIYAAWGEDKSDEIEKGIIIEAETLDGLAEKLGLPAGSLSSTVKQYNEFCANGEDIQFGRHEETLNPLNTTGPYYAFEVVPTFTNTQGGPRRDAEGRILDTNGNPIPHLYSSGELGAIWGDIYQGAGNLSECISFGRISGIAAAAVKDDVAQKSVMDGKTPVNFKIETSQTFETSANEYIGVGSGMGGELIVKVTMDGDKIVSVEILSQNETKGISDPAIEEIPSANVEAQSTEIDTVTGATTTSKAIIQAVTDALSKVKH
jgi:succinate dehydrogenase/fumarate reductase flavoprotein subunit